MKSINFTHRTMTMEETVLDTSSSLREDGHGGPPYSTTYNMKSGETRISV